MYNSKLIHILQVLNSEEREVLKKWLYSPAHNQREDRRQLLLFLLSKRKLTPKTTATKAAYTHVYGKLPYEDKKWKKLMNLCVQLLEKFIHFSAQKKSTFSKQKALIAFFQQHNLNKYAQQYLKKTQASQAKEVLLNRQHFQRQYELEELIFEHQTTTRASKTTNLQSIFDCHYLAFILNTLNYACEAMTHQRLYKSTYDIPLLDPILSDIESGKYAQIPSVQLYYHAFMALKTPQEETHFEVLQTLMFQHYDVLTPKEMKSLYLIAINYCVRQLNNGAEKYVRAVFDLYQYGLEHRILIENNLLSRFTYKNIIAAAIRLKEYAWVRPFIATYTPLLEDMYQKPYALYAKAKLHFSQGDFDTTLELLTQVEFDNLFLSMDSKTMLLKIYYERGHFEALDSLLTSFNRFLQRKSILAYQRKIHKNMIKLTTKLVHLPLLDNQVKIEQLRQEIIETNPLTEKPWLLLQLTQR
ncbi:MAG: hypothetical protein ACRBFS_18935 [Aureispira sp.]